MPADGSRLGRGQTDEAERVDRRPPGHPLRPGDRAHVGAPGRQRSAPRQTTTTQRHLGRGLLHPVGIPLVALNRKDFVGFASTRYWYSSTRTTEGVSVPTRLIAAGTIHECAGTPVGAVK